MSFNNIFLVAALVLVSCGRGPAESDNFAASASSQSLTQLKVQCRKEVSGSRGLTVRDSITLAVDGKEVKLSRIVSSISSVKTTSTIQSITGKINSVFDGNVVKSAYATILLNPTSLTTRSEQKNEERKLGYALIEYAEGKLSVTEPENKTVFSHSGCHTVQ